ncbi:CNP1-like family protein [Paraburkholderia sp. SIMBA_030]|uniref:CNP1-like family protein n=1 Tax=Paraburkholderia sp. SIMBA_030 TaxID=3085773 RepID=UPI00397A6790
MKALALVVACVATGALLAGCSSAGKPTNQDDSAFHYLLDKPTNWVENKVDTLPPLPQDSNLLPFEVSGNTPLQFSIDRNSVSVGSDGVVRYTVVVTSSSGARNVNYEGIRCDTYEWRLYAGLNADHDGWDRTVENGFTRIENGALNAYQATLYQDYMCANKIPTGKASQIVENIRYKRTATSLIR